ncbi:hypothetical protein [Aestuariivirga sp.]|uniref:hypothetical protein n=1 Tax=Aestuariivirga sp. TaxID=2650926 RepID=UPI0039E3801F
MRTFILASRGMQNVPKLIFAATLLLSCAALPVAACDLAGEVTVESLYAAADQAYVGKVMSIERVRKTQETTNADGSGVLRPTLDLVQVRVTERFKGKPQPLQPVYQAQLGDCGVSLPKGGTCLFFTTPDHGAQVLGFASAICDSRGLFSSRRHKSFLATVEQVKALSAH